MQEGLLSQDGTDISKIESAEHFAKDNQMDMTSDSHKIESRFKKKLNNPNKLAVCMNKVNALE